MNARDRGQEDSPVRGLVHALPGGDLLEVDAARQWNSPGYERVVWRVRAGVPIAMVKLYTQSNDSCPGSAVLCDIEVRDGFRGQRLGLDTLEVLGELTGAPLRTSGSYTPSGFAAFAEHLELTWSDREPQVSFDEMAFVRDWDTRTLLHS